MIPLDSYEAQLIADLIEWDFGFTETTFFVNMYRGENGSIHVGRTCVYDTCQRMQPVMTKVLKRQQGSYDVNSNWAVANYRFAIQMCLRLGVLEQEEIPLEIYDPKKDGDIPDCFNVKELTPFSHANTTYWDETHKKQKLGKIKNGDNIEYRFKRSANGKFDSTNGEYGDRNAEYHMKYEKEARFCAGMVLQIDDDGVPLYNANGEVLGKVLPLFDYSKKNVVTHKDWLKAFADSFKAPKSLSDSKAGKWIESGREEGVLYTGDDCSLLKGLDPKNKARTKLKEMDINTIGELVGYFHHRPDRRKNYCRAVRMTMEKLLGILHTGAAALDEDVPAETDHRKATNPYFSRYGASLWKQKVLDTPTMKALVDIQALVEHIYNESKAHFQGTVYEDNWFFYHDALSLMTATETVEWMQREGYYKHWILPENDLNIHIPYFRKVR